MVCIFYNFQNAAILPGYVLLEVRKKLQKWSVSFLSRIKTKWLMTHAFDSITEILLAMCAQPLLLTTIGKEIIVTDIAQKMAANLWKVLTMKHFKIKTIFAKKFSNFKLEIPRDLNTLIILDSDRPWKRTTITTPMTTPFRKLFLLTI